MVAPIIPGLTDPELESILEAVRDAGAKGAGFVMLRMPHEIKDLFTEWLHEHFPDRAAHVLSLMRQVRGGKLYNSAWFTRQRGTGPYAELIQHRFKLAVKKLGLNREHSNLRCDLFRPPERPRKGDHRQMSLL
jgi:DNA repair photolyase